MTASSLVRPGRVALALLSGALTRRGAARVCSSAAPLPLAALFALLLLAASACGGDKPTLTLHEFRFEPNGFVATVGRPLELTVENLGKIEHNLTLESDISGEPIQIVLKPGESQTVTFTPKAAGTFTLQCTLPGHAPAGMTGTLTVQPTT